MHKLHSKKGIAIPSYRGDENQWKEILKLIGIENCVLPLKLVKLVSKVKNETLWRFKEIKNYLLDTIEHNYLLFKAENPLAFEILSYTAYFNVKNISFEFIRTILKNKSRDDLEDALDYLVKNSELVFDCQTGNFCVHELTQNEIKQANKNTSEEDLIADKDLNILIEEEKLNSNFYRLDSAVEDLLVKIGIITEYYLLNYSVGFVQQA